MIAGTISTNDLLDLFQWQLDDLATLTRTTIGTMVTLARKDSPDSLDLTDDEIAERLWVAAHCKHRLVAYSGWWTGGWCFECGWVEKRGI